MIKKFIKYIVAIALVLCTLASAGCASLERGYTKINGNKIYFASDHEIEKWRAALEKLLSNVAYTQYADDAKGEIIGYKPEYPEEPSVSDGIACALFDLTCDGSPELLIDLGGGSAGNAVYEVYNIYTGEKLGLLDSSPGSAVCCYYNTETDGIDIVNKFYWRNGWSTKLFYTSFIIPENGNLTEKIYLESRYEMDMENVAEDNFNIICGGMSCSVWGKVTDPEAYLEECEYFDTTYIRIKETELKYIYWYFVTDESDTPDKRGEKMAAALLSSGQRFIVYND
jgi:hypothetical protein